MIKITALIASACVAVSLVAIPAPAEARRDNQADARKQMKSGAIKSRSEIEARVIPKMKGMRYLGFSYDPDRLIYTLRFIKGQRVVDVVVDARSGAILRRR